MSTCRGCEGDGSLLTCEGVSVELFGGPVTSTLDLGQSASESVGEAVRASALV